MSISKLHIKNLRNIGEISFTPSSAINVICGENGSGKTSILEAINVLGLTRSFRTNKARHLIQTGQASTLVFASIDPMALGFKQSLGVERPVEGEARIRFEGADIDLSTLAELIPLQVINSDTFMLLEGSPAIRRQFLDWGVFHADKAFIQLWRAFRRVLKQRNTLLKCGKIDNQLRQVWDREFIAFSDQLTRLRIEYLKLLQPEFEKVVLQLLGGIDVQLGFSYGWDKKRPLDEVLASNFERDLRQGFTGAGPQRADIKLKVDGHNAAERLSRGQKKLVVSALKLAQGALFQRMNGRPCIYLIDDLPSELDSTHGRLFCNVLEQSANQCFITCVDDSSLNAFWHPQTDIATFRITDGNIDMPM
ncbi:MAG: DNA replication/repair protein RecF [Neptuniibacter caesariensis]|uniref:DNA replication and repair protein RecF n=1 Tax=Neptuniibacter caesariensis TaxID=207954 RepID=A0A2G6JP14_NEPCE|nr:MAG: DNA replication/repair protein RecF [Neptuniibacter caesariensis]